MIVRFKYHALAVRRAVLIAFDCTLVSSVHSKYMTMVTKSITAFENNVVTKVRILMPALRLFASLKGRLGFWLHC